MVGMHEAVTEIVLDTAADVVGVRAEGAGGKCKSVSFDNVPAFMFEWVLRLMSRGLGVISMDIAWEG
jgi:proline racemase